MNNAASLAVIQANDLTGAEIVKQAEASANAAAIKAAA